MKLVLLIGAGAMALALGACDAGPPAVTKSPQASASSSGAAPAVGSAGVQLASQGGGGSQDTASDPRDQPVALTTDGKPLWAANRKHTAQENADYQFGKNGKDFGAITEADYVAKVHRFVDTPPTGVQKLERSNGDALLYDAKTNTFAVVTKAGAPRTMFKPHGGATYWQQQVTRQSDSSKGGDQGSSDS